MKAVAKQPSYISAYPLKVLEQAVANAPDTPQTTRLKALLTKNSSSINRIRVAPMINPYPLESKSLPLRVSTPVQSQEPVGSDWFKQYE